MDRLPLWIFAMVAAPVLISVLQTSLRNREARVARAAAARRAGLPVPPDSAMRDSLVALGKWVLLILGVMAFFSLVGLLGQISR